MAYNETLAERVRSVLSSQRGVTEKKMFGGLTFLVNGNMCCGVMQDEMMVRVGPDAYDSALARPHASQMDFTGKSMRGMVTVSSDGFSGERELKVWVDLGRTFAASLPPK